MYMPEFLYIRKFGNRAREYFVRNNNKFWYLHE